MYVSVCGCVSDGECENSCFSEISRTEPEISTTFFCTHCTACHVFESNTCNLCYFLLLSVTGAGGIYKNSSSRQALTEFFSIVSKHRWIITPPPSPNLTYTTNHWLPFCLSVCPQSDSYTQLIVRLATPLRPEQWINMWGSLMCCELICVTPEGKLCFLYLCCNIISLSHKHILSSRGRLYGCLLLVYILFY